MSKKLVYVLLVLLCVLLYIAACFFGPIGYKSEREAVIKGSYPLVYLMLNDVKEWPKWTSWKESDPSLVFTPGGREVNIGASFTFNGSKYGKGYGEVLESEKDSLFTLFYKYSKFPADAIMNFQIIPQGNHSVYVKSFVRLKKPIPFFKRAFYIGFKERTDNMLQSDLNGLKSYIESLVNSNFGVKQETFKSKKYIGITEPVVASRLPSFFARVYPKIYKLLDSLNIKYTGPPVNLTLGWEASSGYVHAMAALPIDETIKAPLGFDFIEIPDHPCVKLEHFGSYNTLRHGHAKLDYLFRLNNQVITSPIIEEYVTSPSQQPDTSKWQTNIYYLIYTEGKGQTVLSKNKSLQDLLKEEEEKRKKELEDYNKNN